MAAWEYEIKMGVFSWDLDPESHTSQEWAKTCETAMTVGRRGRAFNAYELKYRQAIGSGDEEQLRSIVSAGMLENYFARTCIDARIARLLSTP